MQSRVIGSKTPVGGIASTRATRPTLPRFGVLTRKDAARRRSSVLRAAIAADRAALDIHKMEPLGDRVLVKPMETQEATEGGVLLPSSATDTGRDACFGEVLSVGEDVQLKLNKGDKIVFNMHSSAKVDVSDGEIVFVHDDNILATLS